MSSNHRAGSAALPCARSKWTVLVVNDEPSQLHLTSRTLAHDGYDVLACTTVEEALGILEERPDVRLIVTDLHMPNLDGWRFCRILRSREYAEWNRVPILVLSATFSGLEVEELSDELGANGFLAAPFAPESLREYARDLMRGERVRTPRQAVVITADEIQGALLQRAFEKHDYATRVASSWPEEQGLLGASSPEVIVWAEPLDGGTSEAVLGLIRRHGSRTVGIAITSDPSRDNVLRLLRGGADDYACAPADPFTVVNLAARARRQRSLFRIGELLGERTAALRTSEARFRSLFDSIPDGVVVVSAAGSILEINPRAADRLRCTRAEIVGSHLSTFLHPKSLERMVDTEGRLNLRPELEVIVVSKDGEEIPVEISERRIEFEGQPAILCVARDVAARKQMERQRADFLAMLTHDIRNPVGVILGYSSILCEMGGLDADQEEMLSAIEASANALLLLVNNHLTLSSIEAGRVPLDKRDVALERLLDQVMSQYQTQASRQEISLRLEMQPCTAQVDAVALERIVGNLVHNALKFTPAGGSVVVRGRCDRERAVVEVCDTGPGIPADVLPVLFERYKPRAASRRSGQGTGLGLHIVHVLTQMHGGEVEVDTSEKGTTFRVTLP